MMWLPWYVTLATGATANGRHVDTQGALHWLCATALLAALAARVVLCLLLGGKSRVSFCLVDQGLWLADAQVAMLIDC